MFKAACVNLERIWANALLHMHIQEADLFMKVIIMRANIKLLYLLVCFHYILNPRRMSKRIFYIFIAYKRLCFIFFSFIVCSSRILTHPIEPKLIIQDQRQVSGFKRVISSHILDQLLQVRECRESTTLGQVLQDRECRDPTILDHTETWDQICYLLQLLVTRRNKLKT